MTNIHVLVLQLIITGLPPGQTVIWATSWHSIVTNTYYLLLFVHYTGTNLSSRILAPHGRQEADRHEVLIPRVLVENGIHLGMTNIHVLVLQLIITGLPPGQAVIWATSWHSIVTNTYYLLLFVHYTGTNLSSRI